MKRTLCLALSIVLTVLMSGTSSAFAVIERNIVDVYGVINEDGTYYYQNSPLKNVASIKNGMALQEDGTFWCFEYEPKDVGHGIVQYVPVPKQIMTDVVSFDCLHRDEALIVQADGTLWEWKSEYNNEGQQIGQPTKVLDNVVTASLDYEFSAAVKKDGSLWMWGWNTDGVLGTGEAEQEEYAEPIKVMDHVKDVDCGQSHVAAIKTDGSLWTWGNDKHGELGNNGRSNSGYYLGAFGWQPVLATPEKVMNHVIAVDCGEGYTAAITEDHTLWMWGYNPGTLGNGTIEDSPVPIKVMDDVAAVSCEGFRTYAVKTDGTLWSWGDLGGALGWSGGLDAFQERIKREVKSSTIDDRYLVVPTEIPGVVARVDTLSHSKPAAYASSQSVLVDGEPINFQMYALKDANGNLTNYIKLRDIASLLSGTAAQFDVSWDGAVNILSGQAYTPNGSEMTTPFSGDRAYTFATAPPKVNGKEIAMDAIVLKDDQGGAYTYYKLRDLGEALGFTVDWSAQRGISIETR